MSKREMLLEKLTDALQACIDVYQQSPDVYIVEAGDAVKKAIELVEATLPDAQKN